MKPMKRQNTLMDIWNKSSVKKSTYGSVIYDDKKFIPTLCPHTLRPHTLRP